MVDQIIFIVKGILLTEALTHAVRSWGIFDKIRYCITRRSEFLSQLISCFECSAVWIAATVFIYLTTLEFFPFTCIIIFARLAAISHLAIDAVDAWRAATINKF